MKRSTALVSAFAILSLAACGGGGESQQGAEAIEDAAAQSDPAAAAVLENAAEKVESGEMNAQQALQQAGNAQAGTVPEAQATPKSMQAQPNRTGQQTPPPKVPTGPGAASAGNTQ